MEENESLTQAAEKILIAIHSKGNLHGASGSLWRNGSRLRSEGRFCGFYALVKMESFNTMLAQQFVPAGSTSTICLSWFLITTSWLTMRSLFCGIKCRQNR